MDLDEHEQEVTFERLRAVEQVQSCCCIETQERSRITHKGPLHMYKYIYIYIDMRIHVVVSILDRSPPHPGCGPASA